MGYHHLGKSTITLSLHHLLTSMLGFLLPHFFQPTVWFDFISLHHCKNKGTAEFYAEDLAEQIKLFLVGRKQEKMVLPT